MNYDYDDFSPYGRLQIEHEKKQIFKQCETRRTETTHDYESALNAVDGIIFSDGSGAVCAWYNNNQKTIRHALSEMSRMQKENLVMVPREPTEAMATAAITCWPTTEQIPMWKAIYVSMIAASQEKK